MIVSEHNLHHTLCTSYLKANCTHSCMIVLCVEVEIQLVMNKYLGYVRIGLNICSTVAAPVICTLATLCSTQIFLV